MPKILDVLRGYVLRVAPAAAAAGPADLEAFWSARGFAVIQGYGLTETAPIVSVTHPFDIERGSVGRVIPGVDVKIAADGEIH